MASIATDCALRLGYSTMSGTELTFGKPKSQRKNHLATPLINPHDRLKSAKDASSILSEIFGSAAELARATERSVKLAALSGVESRNLSHCMRLTGDW